MIKIKTSNPINKFEYLGKKNNDKSKTFDTLPLDMDSMKVVRIDKKTIKLVKK